MQEEKFWSDTESEMSITNNVPTIGAVADFEAQNCQPRTNFDTR